MAITLPEPGVRSQSYVSYMCSPWHCWLVELGYPELDVLRYDDGEWAIIQYLNQPLIPCQARWQIVLQGMRRVEISAGFIAKYVAECDMHRKAFWEREEAATRAADQRELDMDRHREDVAEKASQAITRNPDLMRRIARNGLQEMSLDKIVRHIPRQRRIGL